MKKYLYRLKIKTRIIIIYITLLIVTFLATFSMISVINQWYTKKEIGDAGVQTVNALTGNLSFIFDNVTQFSNLIYFDDTIQNSLNRINSSHIDPSIQRDIKKSLVNMILSGDYISGVFIFDQYFNYYNSYKSGPILVYPEKIKNTSWYKEMKKANGNGFFIHNSENVLEYPTRKGKNYISYIREIGNKENYEPIATLLVTIDGETLQKYFEQVSAAYDSQFFIIDSKGNFIIPPKEHKKEYKEYIKKSKENRLYETSKIADEQVIMVSKDMEIQDWKLVGSFQINNIKALAPYYTTMIIIIMCLNVIFVFICSVVLAKMIFDPLSKVENHMKLVEQGDFVIMEIADNEDEINSLKKVFNHMTSSIQELIYKVKEEEQIIAKGQLDIIQAQINPHFLYNTLDAVSALALMKDFDNCFHMTQALGSFYRNSLNSGMDFISIEDEITCIKSYITILNIRYDNKIKVEYDIETDILKCYILKLLLQPIVENAVYHGIKENGGAGTISIKSYQDEEEIIFIVTDDGYGMEEDRIQEVLEGKAKTGKSGFGIYGLIQRINLYYKINKPVTIHSEIGSGTEVTVRVKVMKRGDIDETKGFISR